MNRDDSPPLDDEYSSLLASVDDALAAGRALPDHRASPELNARINRKMAALRLLDRLRPLRRLSAAADATDDAHPSAGVGEDAGNSPSRIGRFVIRRELGRGGFGVVFLAHDPRLGREVALKVPHPQTLVTPELRKRFQYEARAAAALDHPNLVPVFEAGEVGPVCYIASAYCPGITLAAWLKERDAPVPAWLAAGICVPLALAIQHAHSRGVLHRDIKPSNVLLDPADHSGTDLEFTPRLTDFGLARSLAAEPSTSQADLEPSLTRTGILVGTPTYMAPEQAGSSLGGVGPATDVYGLGVILYELLTGTPPFVSESTLDTLERIRRDEPVHPRRIRPRLPRDLETICLKCLEKDPRRRYDSAQALADDLRHFLDGRPIVARPVRRVERVWRWCLREPRVAGLLALLVVVIGAGFGGVFWQWRQARAQATLARAERDTARHERARAEENFKNARAVVVRLSQLADDLRHQPRLDKTRRLLLAEVSEYYERFLTEKGADRGVWLEAARVCNRLAEVHHWLGQWDEEAEALRRGEKLVDALLAEAPTDPAYRRERATGYRWLGRYLWRIGQEREAERAYEKAVVIDEALVAEFPATAMYRSDLANDLVSIAERQRPDGRNDEARANLGRAIALQRALLAASPGSPDYRAELAQSLDSLSRLLWGESRRKEAEALCREALDLRRQVLELLPHPQPAWTREYLARSQAHLALMLRDTGRHNDAEAMYRQRIATAESLVSDYPDAPDYLADQTRGWTELCFLQVIAGHRDAAQNSLQRSLALFRKLARVLPGASSAELKPQANLAAELGGLLRRLGHDRESIRFLDQALKLCPDSPVILNQTAWILVASGDKDVHSPGRAVELAGKAVALQPTFANAWNSLGVAYYRSGNPAAALQALEKSMQLHAGGGGYDWIFLGMAHWKLGNPAEARKWHEKGVRWIRENRPFDEDLARVCDEADAMIAGRTAADDQVSPNAAPPR